MGRDKYCLVAIALTFGSIQAWGAQAPASSTAPAIHASSLGPKGVLTPERQKVIWDIAVKRNRENELNAALSTALRITDGKPITLVQAAVKTSDGNHHVYTQLPDGGLFLSLIETDKALNYHLDPHLRLVVAVRAVNDVPYPIPLADAQAPAAAELKYWADVADEVVETPRDK